MICLLVKIAFIIELITESPHCSIFNLSLCTTRTVPCRFIVTYDHILLVSHRALQSLTSILSFLRGHFDGAHVNAYKRSA